jgi:hypothetical protein
MSKQRSEKRSQQQNKVTINVISGASESPVNRFSYNLTKDISASGAKLRSNCFLPKGALLKINLTLNDPLRIIRVLGRVQWVRSVFTNELFEVGVMFVDTPAEHINFLKDHIEAVESHQL